MTANSFRTLDDAGDLKGKRVLVRVDLNVPMADGKVTDATRIKAAVPTIADISKRGGKVILLAHFGRPKGVDPKESLRPVVAAVSAALGKPVAFARDTIGPNAAAAIAAMKDGDVVVLENTRFDPREERNDPAFSVALAKLGDVYVNDAFSAAHRAHASTEGVARLLPAYAGRSMEAELRALELALGSPKRPLVAIVGGAKLSTKIAVLEHLIERVDALVIGGGMANTFLLAKGIGIGKSLAERDLVPTAQRIADAAGKAKHAIVLPVDAVVATELRPGAKTTVVDIVRVPADQMILDLGPKSIIAVNEWIDRAATVIWNGPVGAFETPPFDEATLAIARHVADQTKAGKLISVAGGGDTVAALNAAGVADDFTFVSTAGGAFLEWMEGKSLPGVEALRAAPRT
jgi:phosphoglycerate kinase